MKCPAANELIESYIDGELDATQRSELLGHLQTCISCAETHWNLQELRTNLRNDVPYYQAPGHLRARISRSLRHESGRKLAPRLSNLWPWTAIAASLLLALSVGWNVQLLRSRQTTPDRIASEILSNHVHSLTANHLLDVPSTDQHTVKPWFNGKVDFAPPVKDLASQGYPLIGARIEYIDEKPVAVLVYQSSKHIINVFTWPEPTTPAPKELQRRGFNLIAWTNAGMTYWAVSDLNLTALREFVRLL